MPHRRRGRPRNAMSRQDRRAHLLDAATAVIRRHGAAVSMEAIAAEAGVTKPVLYGHFGDKSGLRVALAERFGGELVASLRAALSPGGDPRTMLASAMDSFLSFIEREPSLYRFLLELPAASGESAPQLAGLVTEVGREVAVALGEQLRAAGLDSGPAEPWAFGLVGLVYLAGDWWARERSMPRARLVEYLTSLLWDGFSGLGLGPAHADLAVLAAKRRRA